MPQRAAFELPKPGSILVTGNGTTLPCRTGPRPPSGGRNWTMAPSSRLVNDRTRRTIRDRQGRDRQGHHREGRPNASVCFRYQF